MPEFYDWTKTLSFDAPITMVISARGFGKTYGLRKQFINDFLKNDYRFAEIARQKNELAPLMSNYFDRLSKEFPKYMFKCEQYKAYIAHKPRKKNGKLPKPNWKLCGYFIAMSQFQLIKKMTFFNVKRLLLDEAVMEKNDKFHRYASNEWEILTSIVDTVSRERENSAIKPRVYLLGNACDILNPYFSHADISGDPETGYTWHNKKTFLLHYVENSEYAVEKRRTVAGMMDDNDNSVSVDNKFDDSNKDLIMKKTPESTHLFTFVWNGNNIGIWCDATNGWYFVTDKTPKDKAHTYALTLDEKPNHLILQRTNPMLKMLYEAYRMRYVKFDTLRIHGEFLNMLRYVGYR